MPKTQVETLNNETSRVGYTNRFNFSRHSLHKIGQKHIIGGDAKSSGVGKSLDGIFMGYKLAGKNLQSFWLRRHTTNPSCGSLDTVISATWKASAQSAWRSCKPAAPPAAALKGATNDLDR
jgi:hypothetical protein